MPLTKLSSRETFVRLIVLWCLLVSGILKLLADCVVTKMRLTQMAYEVRAMVVCSIFRSCLKRWTPSLREVRCSFMTVYYHEHRLQIEKVFLLYRHFHLFKAVFFATIVIVNLKHRCLMCLVCKILYFQFYYSYAFCTHT